MNTRVSQGPKHEPPVEVSFPITPARKLTQLFAARRGGSGGTWSRSPLLGRPHINPNVPDLGALSVFGPRGVIVGEWLVGPAVLAFGGLFGWGAWGIYTTRTALQGRPNDFDYVLHWGMVVGVSLICVIFFIAGAWLCPPFANRVGEHGVPKQRVTFVFGTGPDKLANGPTLEPGLYQSGPEMTAFIPWSHVIGTSVGESQLWIVCLGRRLIEVPVYASPLNGSLSELIDLAAKVERAARGEMTEREQLLSLITLGGPKCPRCSYVMRGVSEQCPECGVNVVDVMGSRGQLGSGDLRLMRRLWDTDLPA